MGSRRKKKEKNGKDSIVVIDVKLLKITTK